MADAASRSELLSRIETALRKLYNELQPLAAEDAAILCVDAWTIGDLLAVRCWWSNVDTPSHTGQPGSMSTGTAEDVRKPR